VSRGTKGHSYKRHGNSIDISQLQRSALVTESAEVFVPEHAFSDFPVEPRLKANIARKGYSTPTPIQDRAIPHILHGEDVVGIANTGTGKTAAFLIPIIDKILKDATQRVLVIVPTRELAIQIQEEFHRFSEKLGINAVLAVGGTPMGPQLRDLSCRYHVIIGTLGRIRDLVERKCVDLSKFRTVVLDEADRMLDMGFIHTVRVFLSLMSTDRQTLFFSATFSKEIDGLIHAFLPIRCESVSKHGMRRNTLFKRLNTFAEETNWMFLQNCSVARDSIRCLPLGGQSVA
jgi:superfamily II DNA/RNA helicase